MVDELDLDEAFTIMYAAFKGFGFIEKSLGYFQLSEDLIGFTEEGKPKVWLNRQYFKNKTDSNKPFLKRNQSEQIKQIYHMLADKLKKQSFSE